MDTTRTKLRGFHFRLMKEQVKESNVSIDAAIFSAQLKNGEISNVKEYYKTEASSKEVQFNNIIKDR